MPSGRVPPSGLGISTRRDGSARYAPECTRSCRSSKRSSIPASYWLHTMPSTPAAAVFFSLKKAQRSASVVMWCKSAVSFSCGFLVAACRIRSTACDTLSRPCVRCVLWPREFPLVEALPSGGSAGALAPLFAAFTGTIASSDFFIPCIIGYGVLLPAAAPVRLPGQNEDLPGPGEGRTNVHGFSDTVEPGIPSPLR